MTKKEVPQRIIKLEKWLADNNARGLRYEELENGDVLQWYAIGSHVFMIQYYTNDNGWEVYLTPQNVGINVNATLNKMSEWLKQAEEK